MTVYGETPSTASTTTIEPSDNYNPVNTSNEKSTWPGESIKLIKTSSYMHYEPTINSF